MLEKFIDFIKREKLFAKREKVLLAVSGGVDSMVMLKLFLQGGFRPVAAHCNFLLRGEESDKDQEFVKEYCRENNVEFFTKKFDTSDHAKTKGISLQMAARELRYEWFSSLLKQQGIRVVAIAHNKNDLAETFLLNISRGTGIRGLTGMGTKSREVVRPLLFASREEIEEFASSEKIPFRTDSSNREVKYDRNRIRHRIIPEMEKINPAFIDTVHENTQKLKDTEKIYTRAIEEKFHSIYSEAGSQQALNISGLLMLEPLHAYLYEFLKKWNFSSLQIPDIIESLGGPPGKQFFSPTHRLVKDRTHLYIAPLKNRESHLYYIDEQTSSIKDPLHMEFSNFQMYPGFQIPRDPNIACLDAQLLHFPLILRKWKQGDYFQPLGMSGLKKLSDFFIDNKFSLFEKESVWILASGDKIVWIVGHRIDNRFRITGHTSRVYMAEVKE